MSSPKLPWHTRISSAVLKVCSTLCLTRIFLWWGSEGAAVGRKIPDKFSFTSRSKGVAVEKKGECFTLGLTEYYSAIRVFSLCLSFHIISLTFIHSHQEQKKTFLALIEVVLVTNWRKWVRNLGYNDSTIICRWNASCNLQERVTMKFLPSSKLWLRHVTKKQATFSNRRVLFLSSCEGLNESSSLHK